MPTKEEVNLYWIEREREHNKRRVTDENAIKKRLNRKYEDAREDIQEQIEAFYGRYASREGLDIREARKRVKSIDIEKYKKKAERYVKERNFTPRANEEMRLYNVTMRVNRLELLKKNIELELIGLYSDEEREHQEELSKYAREEYERHASILGDSVLYNEKKIEQIVDSSFLTAHWSDRIWTNQDALRMELDKLLNRGITQGLHPTDLARELRKQFDVGIFNSERLLITEFARVQKDVFIDSMEQGGIDQYEYLAEPTACPICAELDEQVFNVKDAEVGVNMYPMHPFCRCSSSGYIDREALMREFDERGLFAEDDPRFVEEEEEEVGELIPAGIADKLTEDQKKAYNNALANGSPDAKELWENYKDEFEFKSTNSNRAYFMPEQGVYMNVAEDVEGSKLRNGVYNKKPTNVFFHEFGHHIDFNAESKEYKPMEGYMSEITTLSNGKTLGQTVFDEVQTRIKEQEGRLKRDRIKNLKALLDDDTRENPSSMGSISDLFGGATNNQLRIYWGHSDSYWKTPASHKDWMKYNGYTSADYRNNRLGHEAFAEMFASDIMDKEEQEKFKKWLPESWEGYKELVKEINKKKKKG